VLDGPGDTKGEQHLGPDMLTGLAHQCLMVHPSGMYNRARGPNLGIEQTGQFKQFFKFTLGPHASAAGDDNIRLFNAQGFGRPVFRMGAANPLGRQIFGQIKFDHLALGRVIMGQFMEGAGPHRCHLGPGFWREYPCN